MSKQHGLYKYVTCDTNEIIYIGKTNNSFKSRIDDHSRGKGINKKFNSYKGNYKIYIAYLPNATETNIAEKALINKYKPILNSADNYDGFSGLVEVREPDWKEYIPEGSECIRKKSKRDIWEDGHLLLKETSTAKIYITNYTVKEKGHRVKKNIFRNKEQAIAYITLLCDACIHHGNINEDNIHNEFYRVPGRFLPKEIYEDLTTDTPNMLTGPLWIVQDSLYTTKNILTALRHEGNFLDHVCFDKTSIDLLTEICRNKAYRKH